MASNSKIRLRSSELYKNKNYKVRPTLANNPLWDSLLAPQKIDGNKLAAIYYEGEEKSISEINNQSDFNLINEYRSADIGHSSVLSTEDTTLEYLPEHYHITEMIANIQRMETEYSQKLGMLDYLVSELFDTAYATNIAFFGRASQLTVSSGKISPVVGYIIADNATESLKLNLVIRGVPIPMRKTETSSGTYYFTYPQYLVDTDESINSVQHIEVLNQGSATLWRGTSTSLPIYSDSGDYVNLRIVNNETRNSSAESVSDPAWNS